VVNGWFFASLTAGSGQYLAALIRWLPKVGDRHEFILVRNPKRSSDSTIPPGWQVQIVSTPFDSSSENLAKLWFEQIAFPRSCQRLQADVAWTPYWGSSWWRPCPVVVTVHDLIPLLLPAYRGALLQRTYTGLVSRAARRAAAILTDSEASRGDIVRVLKAHPNRVHTIPLATEEGSSSAVDVRARYSLPDEPFLLYFGGFDVRKNLSRTLEAYARLLERLEQAGQALPKLVIAGRLPRGDSTFAPDPRPIIERLRIDQHVHLTGWVDEHDKPALYSQALAVLFLSEYEGFGLPVLEAMAAASSARSPG
jgi:glycosyltransferase involved in cell wall biosynthesis